MARLYFPRLDPDAREERERALQRLGYLRATDPELIPGEYRVLLELPDEAGPALCTIEVEEFADDRD